MNAEKLSHEEYNEDLIKILIDKLKPEIQPEGIELKRLCFFGPTLNAAFYEVFKIYLPVSELTIEELDKLTGYSKQFLEERKKAIGENPSKRTIKNAFKGLEFAKKESTWVRNLMGKNLGLVDGVGGNEWFALNIVQSSYNSTVLPIYKNLEALLFCQGLNSKRSVSKFFEDALIGYSIAHFEGYLYRLSKQQNYIIDGLTNQLISTH